MNGIPYYRDDSVVIWNDDCIRALAACQDGTFDLAVADPPYNYGVEYDGYADQRDDYAEWCAEWFAELRRVARAVVVTPGHGNLPMWFNIARPHGIGCWYKPGNAASSHLGWCEWEPWLYWGKRIGGSDVIRATTNISFGKQAGHPCPKPVLLVKLLIAKTKATSIIDPFLGSGTSLVAAKQMGIRGAGIEQSTLYCDVAVSRLTQGVLDLDGAA